MWLANGIVGEWIEYELDRVYPLGAMWVWNYNQVTPTGGDRMNRGIRNCTIEYSADGISWASLGGTHFLAQADGSDSYAHNTEIDFGGTEARFVRITVVDNHGGSAAGLSEVRFHTTEPRVSFEIGSSEVLELAQTVQINVVLSEPRQESVTVDYAVAGGTASAGEDYLLFGACRWDLDASGLVDWPDLEIFSQQWLDGHPSGTAEATGDSTVNFFDYRLFAGEWQLGACGVGTLEFEPGTTSASISLIVIEDALQEDDETVLVDIFNPSGGDVVLGGTTRHFHTILGENGTVEVSFETDHSRVDESSILGTLPVILSRPSASTVTVNYAATGGTAIGGRIDYLMDPGQLVFQPGQTSRPVLARLVDDFEIEDNETIEISLSEPVGAVPGSIFQSELLIIDNDAGVWLDDLRWFHSEDRSRMSINEQGQLEWDLEKSDQLYVRLPEQRLDRTGDVVEVSFLWKSQGRSYGCDCSECPGCFDDYITCVAGTGDFRIGVFEADGEYVYNDGLGTSNSIFSGYKGYRFRIFPSTSTSQGNFVCLGESHTSGSIDKRTNPGASSLLSINNEYSRLRDINGFGLESGTFSPLVIRLERLSSSSVRVSITLNGLTYSTTDSSSSNQADRIDVFAIHFPNGRPYTLVTFATMP
jgi:hypothetical protein